MKNRVAVNKTLVINKINKMAKMSNESCEQLEADGYITVKEYAASNNINRSWATEVLNKLVEAKELEVKRAKKNNHWLNYYRPLDK